ncbi:MAG: hypothetical protein FH749_09965 [Firmicutes bacterium]|nr:hypothetical protein [Bacillota bacterium]
MQRSSLISWVVCLGLFGIFLGGLGQEAQTFFADNPQLEEFYAQAGAGSISDGTYVIFLRLVAILVAAFGIITMSRMRNEEQSGRVEAVLGQPPLAGATPAAI